MTENDTVKALRCYSLTGQCDRDCDKCENHPTEYRSDRVTMGIGADLIERLQTQLAESQRRERAAVKCIQDVETYLELGSAKYIKKTIDDWRGPQQAGKGEAG